MTARDVHAIVKGRHAVRARTIDGDEEVACHGHGAKPPFRISGRAGEVCPDRGVRAIVPTG